ncbi:tigger transposable element-derived 6-like [Brachionus plicatilis]|uniref:Tigger transposable element-derived 6-like n=1 Tax=Brachionus plicatilis TaxID=10195 RepID=A0A3M7SFK3_BRAPC|nr:tigger transposable element-derived 6-like [Brachionus plicatilis]
MNEKQVCKKRKCISLEVKIKKHTEQKITTSKLAKKFNVNASTISNILSSKAKIFEHYEKNLAAPGKKRIKLSSYDNVDQAVLYWFDQWYRNSITGVFNGYKDKPLQEQNQQIVKEEESEQIEPDQEIGRSEEPPSMEVDLQSTARSGSGSGAQGHHRSFIGTTTRHVPFEKTRYEREVIKCHQRRDEIHYFGILCLKFIITNFKKFKTKINFFINANGKQLGSFFHLQMLLVYGMCKINLSSFRECNMVQHSKLHLLSMSANDVQNLCKMQYARTY